MTKNNNPKWQAVADGYIRFFKSWFHCFDATVILAGFVIDVCLKNVLEEAGSIVIVLRLWRYVVPSRIPFFVHLPTRLQGMSLLGINTIPQFCQTLIENKGD